MLFGITLRSPMTRKFRLRVGGIFTIVFHSYCTIPLYRILSIDKKKFQQFQGFLL